MLAFHVKALFVIFCVAGVENLNAAEVPDFIKVCHREDPDLKNCMIKSVEALRPYLQKGYAEYNIPSVEPIEIKDLIKEEAGGLKIETSDVFAYGGGDYVVTDLSVDLENNLFEVDILLPKLVIDAKYSLDGKLVMVPVKGNGQFHANLTDCSARAKLKSEIYEKGGEDYIRFRQNDMKVKVGGGTVRFDNLFNGEKTLSDLVNETINKNLQPFVKELLPYIEKGLAKNFMETGNKMLEPYTRDQLFPK